MIQKPENIDRFFSNALENYEAVPDDSVWENIAQKIARKKQRTVFFYVARIAAAVILVTSLGIITYYLHLDPVENNPVIENLSDADQAIPSEQILPQTNVNEGQSGSVISSQTLRNSVPNTEIPGTKALSFQVDEVEGVRNATPLPSLNEYSDNEYNTKRRLTIINALKPASIPILDFAGIIKPVLHEQQVITLATSIIPDEFSVTDDVTGNTATHWNLGGEFAPLYTYRYVSSGRLNNQQINDLNDAETGLLAYAGGITVSYAPSGRFTVQTGLYYAKYGQEKQRISSYRTDNRSEDFATLDISDVGHIAITNSTGFISPSSGSQNQPDILVISAGSGYYENMDNITAIQYFDFLELPLIVKYKIVDRKIDFRMLGGMVTNLMIGNRVYLKQDNDINYYGKTEDVQIVNYIGMIGMGLEYPFTGHFTISVEPRFSYYLNNIDRTTGLNVHPYSFGVFTGINYSF